MQQVKSKKLTYLLLCAVIGVWGIILYKFFFRDKEEDLVPKTAFVKKGEQPYDAYQEKPDTFKLVLNYRDPFALKPTAEPMVQTAQKEVVAMAKMPIQPPPVLNWSGIRYTGMVLNPVSKKTVTILSVNGKERMVPEGEVFENVKVFKNR